MRATEAQVSSRAWNASKIRRTGVPMYLALALLPPLAFYLLPVSSQSPGVALALMAALGLLARQPAPWQHWQLLLPLLCALGLLLHMIVAAQWQSVDWGRFGGSLLLLIGILLVAGRVAPMLFDGLSQTALLKLFAFFGVCGLLALLGLVPPATNATSKPVFPFSEASHFGLALCPLVLSVAVMTRSARARMAYVGSALALALLLQNFTLVVGLMLVAAICLPWRWLLPVSVLGVAAVATALDTGASALAYYAERLNFTAESENLTALVVLQGWQIMGEAVDQSSGWGLGFQQLGVQGPITEVSESINLLNQGNYLNLLDGGFLLAKLVAELGVWGIVLALVFSSEVMRCSLQLRRVALQGIRMPAGWVFAHAVLVMYSLEVFVRSPGYLTGSAALLLTAVCYLYGHGGAHARGS